jgi:broad specificity phosphatase PhoE
MYMILGSVFAGRRVYMKIYITRHGETQWNTENRIQGWSNSNLTNKGIENAKRLGESLSSVNIDLIYCSPLGRTIETAKYILGNKNTEIIIDEHFKEMNLGAMEGMTRSQAMKEYPKEYTDLWDKPHVYEPIGGESFIDLIDRVKQGLNNIIKDNAKDKNILLVAHTIVIKAIFVIVKGIELEKFWSPPFIKDTSLTIIDAENGKMKITLEADISHLE